MAQSSPVSAYGSPGFNLAAGGGFNPASAALYGGGAAPKRHRSFGHGLASDLVHTVTGIVPGTIHMVGTVGGDLIHHSVPAAIYEAFTGHPHAALNDLNPLTSNTFKGIVAPMARSEYDYYRHFGTNIREGHILTPILDAATLLSLGAGRLAALGLTPEELGTAARTRALVTGRYGGDARTITAELPSGETQLLRTLPRSGYRAQKAILVEKGLRRTFGDEGLQVGGRVVGKKLSTVSRATKAAQRDANAEKLSALSDPRVRTWQKAFSKLSVNEREAFHVKARLPIQEDLDTWKGILATSDQPSAQQMLGMIDKPEVQALYKEPSEKLQGALDAWHGIADARQEILLKHGAIDPYSIEEGKYRHTMLMRGAEALTKSKAYNHLRALNAQIGVINRGVKALPGKGAKVGQKEIRAQIREGVRASGVAIRSSAKREKYYALAQTTDEKLTAARQLRGEMRDAAAGRTDPAVLQRLGIEAPAEKASYGPMATAFTKAEIVPKMKAAQKTLDRLDKATADPEWKPKIDKQIEDLQAQYEKKDPVKQGPWRQRLGDQLAQLKLRRTRLQAQSLVRKNYEARIAKHQADLDALGSGELVDSPYLDIHSQALGKLTDETGKAYDEYEKALVAEHAHQEASMRGRGAAAAQREAEKGVGLAREERMKSLQGLRVKYHELIDARHELIAQRDHMTMLRARISKANVGPLVGGGTPAELAAEFEKAGIKQSFIPDVPATKKGEFLSGGEPTMNPPRPQADVYPTTGAMFRHGMVDIHSDPMTPSFFRAVQHQTQLTLHNFAMRAGKEIEKDEAIPPGWVPVRAYRGQRIPQTLTMQAEHMREMNPFEALNPDEFDEITGPADLPAEETAKSASGKRVIVPQAMADRFSAEFSHGTTLGRKLIRNATQVWRSLLLKTRISWLENNIIGNTILAAVRFAGVDGMKAYLNLVANVAGPKKALELLRMPVTRKGLTDEQFARLVPEALRSSYIETNLPAASRLRFGAGAAGMAEKGVKGAFNLLPRADRWYETFLRKGAVETTLRAQPEIRAIYNAMPKGEKDWGAAMEQGLSEHPELHPLVVREMNDALGDFLSMTRFERDQVRQLIPFYSWFREITKIAAKTVYDTPGRAKLLQLIGQVGAEIQPENVPSYLLGGLPVHVPSWLGGDAGPGQQTVVQTRSMNPYTTVLDLFSGAAAALAHGKAAPSTLPIASLANPGIAALLNLSHPQEILHIPLTRSPIFQPVSQTIMGIPQIRALFGPKSTLYPTRGPLDTLTQQAGSPIRTYSIAQALAKEGQ